MPPAPVHPVEVRGESPGDRAGTLAVQRAAFGREAEADLVARLAAAGALEQSLVAVADGSIVGHVVTSAVRIERSGPGVLGLGPIAVAPSHQRRGIGARLMAAVLDDARASGWGAVVLLGDPAWYARFGFGPATRFGLRYPGPVPEDAFMALELVPGALAGRGGLAHYHPAFADVPTGPPA